MIVLSAYALFESSQISVVKPNVEFDKLVCFIENRDQNPFLLEAFTIYLMPYVDMNTLLLKVRRLGYYTRLH